MGIMKKKLLVFAGVFVLGFASYGAMNVVFDATNEMEFCTSCHSMKINLAEYKETAHYKNQSGVQASCSDCHVPKEFLPKVKAKIIASKDVYHEFLGNFAVSDEIKNDPEAYQEHYDGERWRMANIVWDKMRANNSAECRTCHTFEAMDIEAQSRSAQRRHPRAIKEGETCIDCHKGVAHHEPMEPMPELENLDLDALTMKTD
jgi:cytochrome c-type protein NapC